MKSGGESGLEYNLKEGILAHADCLDSKEQKMIQRNTEQPKKGKRKKNKSKMEAQEVGRQQSKKKRSRSLHSNPTRNG